MKSLPLLEETHFQSKKLVEQGINIIRCIAIFFNVILSFYVALKSKYIPFFFLCLPLHTILSHDHAISLCNKILGADKDKYMYMTFLCILEPSDLF